MTPVEQRPRAQRLGEDAVSVVPGAGGSPLA